MPTAARGRPKGPSTQKPWREAIERAVKRAAEDGKTRRLDALADRLVDAGLSGDVPAMREIGDRLDGKPAQAIVGDTTMPAIVTRVEIVAADGDSQG